MKICLIGGIYKKGGSRKDFIDISPETVLEAGLRSAGHEVTALSHYDDGSFDPFDVVHVHHLSWGATRLASDPSRVPFVFTAHDTTRMCGFSQPFTRRAAMRYVFSRADAAVALSGLEADFQRGAYRLGGALHATIPNGIDADLYSFKRENSAGQDQPWKLLFVGQLTPQKRVDLLLKALPLLHPDIELTLVYQNVALENELKTLAEALDVSRRVHFLGKRNPAQLAALYHASDLLVLPSAWEALPSVISEAMLCGLPFVASATGGIPEQANGFGVLLEKRNETELAKAILRVLTHYEEFARTSQAMATQARERFAIPKMIERHLDLYRRVTAAAKVPRRHALRYAALNAAVRQALRWHSGASVPRQAVART
jgi:glycosyltransferase involved in cell wall biosynthesis